MTPSIEELIRVLIRDELQRELAKTAAEAKPPASYVSVAAYAKARTISISTVRNAIRDGRLAS